MKVIKHSACELDSLIEQVYKREFNTPYSIMMDQKLIEKDAEPTLWEGQKEMIEAWKNGEEPESWDDLLDALMNDLCAKKKLKKGHYLLEFDD